jgi:hypothetical protein
MQKPPVKILFMGLVIALLVFTACDPDKQNAEELQQIISKINKKCPAMIDSETQLDGIDLKNEKTIRYNHTLIHIFVNNIDTHQFYLDMWPGLLSTVRVSPEMQKMRDNKMNFEYFYRDRAHQAIYTFKISPKDYSL